MSAWSRFARNRLAVAGLVTLGLVAAIALAAPLLPLADPNTTDLSQRLLPPLSAGHWLGTDHLGRDLLARLVWGTRVSLAVALAATLVAGVAGSLLGLVAGFAGGRLDTTLMRGIDVLMAFPYILLALAIVAALGPGLLNALIAVAVVNVPFFARTVRGVTVGLVRREFMVAAKLSGRRPAGLVLVELLPNVLPAITVTLATTLGWMILETAGLSFLGLGAQPPQADLGSMLGEGRKLLVTAPFVAVLPGLVILVVVMAVNLLGDGIRDLLDPRLRGGAPAAPGAVTTYVPHPELPGPEAPPVHDKPLLAVEALRTWFFSGPRVLRAVDGVDLDLASGECLGVVGESGCGKSVTALSLLGLVPSPPGRIVGGSVRLEGEELLGAPLERLRQLRGGPVAYVFQDPATALNPLMTVGEQLIEAIRAHQDLSPKAARARAVELLDTLEIPDPRRRVDSHPHTLSGGQRQRVAIAMALANDPRLLILDEPTTALDVTTQARILRLLARAGRERGMGMLFITHDFGIVSELCDRVVVMYAGQVVESGTVAELFDDPRHPYTRGLLACVPRLGEPERHLAAIPGRPPAADAFPEGCRFAERCAAVLEACRAAPVALEVFYPGRTVRCIRVWDDI